MHDIKFDLKVGDIIKLKTKEELIFDGYKFENGSLSKEDRLTIFYGPMIDMLGTEQIVEVAGYYFEVSGYPLSFEQYVIDEVVKTDVKKTVMTHTAENIIPKAVETVIEKDNYLEFKKGDTFKLLTGETVMIFECDEKYHICDIGNCDMLFKDVNRFEVTGILYTYKAVKMD